uniref:UDP-glucose ceramide glucosyltransferase-like 1 n=1 Tax=Astyanax mexicanus TaxID=7994 RepID=A0A8B9JKG7_ASTMX
MWLLCVSLVILHFVASADGSSKAVTTTLTTKWPSAPLLLEYIHFFNHSKVQKQGVCFLSGSDLSYYELIIKRAGQLLSPVQLKLLKFALSLRSYSSTIHSFQQIASNEPPPPGCRAFFSVHGEKSCDPESLKTMIDTASERYIPKPFLFKGDHRFTSSNPGAPVVILYAELGTKEFASFHQQMLSRVNKGLINYVLRHYLPCLGKLELFLSGYGVELAIKNQEYKAKDDTQVQGNDPVDEVQGFLFGKLKTIYPELKEQLKELRKHLVESTNDMAPLKVWQLQDLSFQTAARILAAPPVDALNVMRDLSQNFPTKARSITKTVVNSEIRKEIEENQKYFKGSLGLQPGDSALFINGLHIDLDVQDIFSVFDVLRNEARDPLYGFTLTQIIQVSLSLHLSPSLSLSLSLSLSSSSLQWVNNLETDGRYASWPSNVQELLRPTFPGVIKQIRKNFHNLVMIIDPTHENTAELLSVAEMFYSNNIPLRIGLVFVVNDADDIDGMQDAGVAMLRAFNYIADEVDNQMAFDAMLSRVPSGGKLKVEHVVGVLEKRYPYVEVRSILGADSAYDSNRKEGKAYYQQTGVGPLPVVLYNGMPLQREQLDPDELETTVMHKILETTSFFQRAVYLVRTYTIIGKKRINDSKIIVCVNALSPKIKPSIQKYTKRYKATSQSDLNILLGMDVPLFQSAFESPKVDFLLAHSAYCRDVLKLRKGQRAVISNGRVTCMTFIFCHFIPFFSSPFLILKTSGERIKSKIQQLNVEEDRASDLVMKVDALLSSQPKGEARVDDLSFFVHSAVKIRPKEEEVYFDVVAVVDPVTRDAQKLAPLLLVLKQLVNVNLRVFMNCQSRLSDMPLKSFYRYVLDPEVTFMTDNSFSPGPMAKFLDMPQSPLFTLNLNTPESWMVESVHTRYDLDNIYLEEVDTGVAAEYELEYLLLEGHCFDVSTGQPPRGLQFTLGTAADPVIVDTIVMANLGYFQLKANPGAWILRLRKGRSDDIYKIYSHDGTDSPAEAEDLIVVLNNFKSKIIKVKVQKKPDKMNEELLSDATNENDSGFWQSLTRCLSTLFKTISQRNKTPDKDDVINIFSVASGHLYERFLRIMMLSVLKHTKTPVKFWFLKNYLSPTFKEWIPYMAKEYGFQYELVQYKWPRWLHQQTEKQRIIWGYKILFLDVLFPLAVDKILFVDADQIVRTDLKELRDFDLEGAPYGYTPFCESRREMDGYRFWKSGYWASHLAGRKYHISALYVVDLKKFRKIAAGDRLRGQYQGLSQDPNSLSNLDQDLPNNMIHQVPIKSLPQEWLWCETWCDDSSKKNAKTIDLCNNPQTKEPKLQAAVRIVSEWTDYDQEVKRIYNKFLEERERGGPSGSSQTQGRTQRGTNVAQTC